MKKFNTLQTTETFETSQELAKTPLSKEKARDLGGAILEISEKTKHFSKKRERFAYLNDPDSQEAKEHLEDEIALKNRRQEEIENGYFDERDDFIVNPKDYKILSKQLVNGAGKAGIDLVASKYLKHGIALADMASRYDTVVYLDKSARPLDGLARKVLKNVMPDKKRPDSKFLNIDRNWVWYS